ncbi:hypothetical protein DFJ74DRAFT_394626 [Hyaloraphidium curvatum]|nr:hypothetical protein DFJ74DRAFT_394626 [Hyaloraphidium curvatum]
MSQIDHVTVVVRNIDQAISNYKAAGFSVHPSPDNATAAVAQAFVPFADYTFIRLIQFKSQPTAAPYTTLRARVENEGVADIAILARAGDLERLRTAAPGVTYSAVEDDPLIKVKRITVAGASPFPSFVADTGDRGARGVPFGPQFLVHANGAKGIRTALFSANDTAGCAAKLAALVGGKTESGRVRIGPADIKMIKAQKGEGPCEFAMPKSSFTQLR